MCYFEQTRWSCGYWRWGHFKQQCNKEYRMGETCGLKLVYHTIPDPDVCRLCHDREKKERRLNKMIADVERWKQEGNRTATIERTEGEMAIVQEQICAMNKEHALRQFSLAQVREMAPLPPFLPHLFLRRRYTRHRRELAESKPPWRKRQASG
ncbi:hypothetical protein M419DRAFT_91501 [Trichoderma reesei RUT C-30]|jgi:hypothetical protein|uniref:Uncharacterized protein n=2 Tax=Hypocrea jecorina TaxID=51453 RepID=A0A024RZ68_HYPJR|nr:hypothetical protein M419DRAFT_91501 [Trichoderma reesei RUT C-30]